MEIFLLLIAGVVAYFLYNTLRDYLKNPLHHPSRTDSRSAETETFVLDNPYQPVSEMDRIREGEFGILSAILGHIVWSDGKECKLQENLIDSMLTDMANELKNPKVAREMLEEILLEQRESSTPLEVLCDRYVILTKGEYRKRLKVVEFLFVLAYADGELAQAERECIIDVAAYFDITNDDFNAMYETFKSLYESDEMMSVERAKEIFSYTEDMDAKKLDEIYQTLIKESKQNIFDSKNFNKNLSNTSIPRLKEIDQAYRIIDELIKARGVTQEMEAESTNQ